MLQQLPQRSKFKNAFNSSAVKNQIFTNLTGAKQTSGDGNIINANEIFFAIPWSYGSGSVLVYPRKPKVYKIPTDPDIVLGGHKDVITDAQFSPFDPFILMTASNDTTCKLFKIPPEFGTLGKNLEECVVTFSHPKKVNLINFQHPVANGVLVSCCQDFSVRLWDVNKSEAPLREISGDHTDLIQSTSWNYDGSVIVTSCRDTVARVYDPRTKTLLVHGNTHENTSKGFKTIWLGRKEQFVTVGFSKNKERELALWDLRKGLKKAIQRTLIDTNPSHCFMFFDFGNSLLYLAGKGDSGIKLYECNDKTSPYVNFISEFKTKETQTGLCLLPQRVNNILENEIAQFMKLTGNQEVDTISIKVPRKDSLSNRSEASMRARKMTQSVRIGPETFSNQPSSIGSGGVGVGGIGGNRSSIVAGGQRDRTSSLIFNEDIYPDIPSGKPALSTSEWFSGADSKPKLMTLKKENMTSIFDLAIEDGGKMRPQEENLASFSGKLAGNLRLTMDSDYDTIQKFWALVTNKEIELYANKDETNKKPLDSISLTSILSVFNCDGINSQTGLGGNDSNDMDATMIGEDELTEELIMFQIQTNKKMIFAFADNPSSRNQWVETLQKTIPRFFLTEKPIQGYFLFAQILQGQMNKLPASGWVKRFVHLAGNTLFFYSSRKQTQPKFILPLSEVTNLTDESDCQGLTETEMELVLQMISGKNGEKILLLSSTESQKDFWFEFLTNILTPVKGNDNLLVSLGLEKPPQEHPPIQSESGNPQKAGGKKQRKFSKAENDPPGKLMIFPVSAGSVTESDLRELFEVFGGIDSIQFYEGGKLFKNYTKEDLCIITFRHEKDAEAAVNLNGSTIDGQKVTVQMYLETEAVNPLYIKVENLDIDASLDDVAAVFKSIGEVEHIKIWNSQGNSSKYAYLKYKNKEESLIALSLNKSKFYGTEIFVTEVNCTDESSFFLNELSLLDLKAGKCQILIQMKGNKKVRSKIVRYSQEVMNSKDVFVLDCGDKVFQWNGAKANRFKKARGLEVASSIRKERGGGTNCKMFILDENQDLDSEEVKLFWSILTGQEKQPSIPLTEKSATVEESGDDIEKNMDKLVSLYRISQQQGQFKCKKIASPPLSKDMLKSDYVYLLDCFSEIYIWEGKNSSTDVKKMARRMAMKLDEQRPSWTVTMRVIEQGEPTLFKEKFAFGYPSALPINVSANAGPNKSGTIALNTENVKPIELKPLPGETLLSMVTQSEESIFDLPAIQEEKTLGTVTVWRVEGFDKVEYPQNFYGHFFSGDSYVILYQYKKQNRSSFVVYFWQGRDCSINEKGASALLSVDVQEEMEKEGECHQVRLTQQKETKHFLSIFSTFVVHLGKFSNYKEVKSEILDIRAIEDLNKKNSYFFKAVGCFVPLALSESKSSCLQLHIGVNDDPKTVILFVNETNLENPVLLTDGVQFVKSLLRTAAYPKLNNNSKIVFVNSKKNLKNNLIDIESQLQSKIADGSLKVRPKRLFQIMARTGVVESAEILDFCQDDLDARDCFLLDCSDHVICWVGFYATFPLKRVVMETVSSYAKIRNLNLKEQVFVVKQFGEPVEWRSEFQGWGEYKVKFRQKLDERLLTLDEVLQDYSRKTYTYAELLGDKLPVGVDESKLETYLSNEEFQEVFKMSREEFDKMPKYKAQELKKKNCLF